MVRLRMRPIYIPLSEIHTFASEAALWNGSVRKSHKLAGRIVFPEWVTLPTVWEWILIAAIIHVVLRAGQNNLCQANCREWRFWIAGTPFKSLKRSVPNRPPLKKISIASPTYIVRTSWSFLQLSFTCDVPLAPLPVLLLLSENSAWRTFPCTHNTLHNPLNNLWSWYYLNFPDGENKTSLLP